MAIFSLAIVWSYILQDNATYLAVQTTDKQTETVARNIYLRAEDLDGFSIENKFMFAGIINQDLYTRDARIYRMSDGLWSEMDSFWTTYAGMKYNWFYIYYDMLGIKLNMCSDEEYEAVISTEEFQSMPVWPNQNSVGKIDGIVVVKLSDAPYMP